MHLSSEKIKSITKWFIFCTNCGSKFEDSENYSKKCTRCKLHFYINPSPTTGAVLINEKNEILLVKRKVDPGKGLWDTPGGFVDLNENLEDSLRRELKEELRIDIKELKYLTSKVDTYTYGARHYQTLGMIFEGKILSYEKLKASDDISGFKFFTRENFPIEKLAFKSLEEFFISYLNLENKA